MIDWFRNEYRRVPGLYLSLGIVLAAFVAYGNSFGVGFHFDDSHHVVGNPFIVDLAHAGDFFVRPDMFSAMPGHDMYRPMVLLSFALDYAAFDFDQRATGQVGKVGPPLPGRVEPELAFQRRATEGAPEHREPRFEGRSAPSSGPLLHDPPSWPSWRSVKASVTADSSSRRIP